jgi:hypothetical protein
MNDKKNSNINPIKTGIVTSNVKSLLSNLFLFMCTKTWRIMLNPYKINKNYFPTPKHLKNLI